MGSQTVFSGMRWGTWACGAPLSVLSPGLVEPEVPPTSAVLGSPHSSLRPDDGLLLPGGQAKDPKSYCF